jgi:hypothetical protein
MCIFIWRRIPSEIISQPEPGVVFEHSLLHSKSEYPDLPQPPKCLPVNQGTFREHSGNIQGKFRESSGKVQGKFREH